MISFLNSELCLLILSDLYFFIVIILIITAVIIIMVIIVIMVIMARNIIISATINIIIIIIIISIIIKSLSKTIIGVKKDELYVEVFDYYNSKVNYKIMVLELVIVTILATEFVAHEWDITEMQVL